MTILFFQSKSTRNFRLKITAGQRKMSDQNGALTGQKLHSPVMLIGAFLLSFRTEQVHREKVFFLDFMEPRSNQWMCALLGKHFTYITKTAKNLAGRMCKQLCFFFFFDKTNKETNKQRENQEWSNLVSKSHTQFCQADSYCSSATYHDKNKFVSL